MSGGDVVVFVDGGQRAGETTVNWDGKSETLNSK